MKRGFKATLIRKDGRAVEALLVLMKSLTAHARWVFVILLLMYAFSGIRTVQSHEQALVLRFGHLQPEVHGPGLMVGLPDPFDRVLRFETGKETALALDEWTPSGAKIGGPGQLTERRSEAVANPLGIPMPEAESPAISEPVRGVGGSLDPVKQSYTLTRDYNLIQGRFVLRYRISNPFLYTVAGENAGGLLQRLGYQALSTQLAVRPIDASLTSDRKLLADQAMAQVQQEVDRLRLGVSISGLDILELSPPSEVIAAFEDVVNARQFAKTLYESSLQYQTENVTRTGGEAASIRSKAESEASGLISVATGEGAAFTAMMEHYRRDPELVSRRLLNDTLETVMQRTQSRTLVPSDQARPSLMLEPLPSDAR